MSVLLFLLSAVAAIIALGLFAASKTGMHEITAAVFALIAAVFFVGTAVVYSVNRIEDRLKEKQEKTAEKKCPKCGGVINPGDEKCRYCADDVKKADSHLPVEMRECPKCSANIKASAGLCRYCGWAATSIGG